MSKIIKDGAGCIGMSHVVETADGRRYAISSIIDRSMVAITVFKTAVFEWDKSAQGIANWSAVLTHRCPTEKEMRQEHLDLCNNLEKYV